MTVYVGDLFVTLKSRKWPYSKAAHLFADTDEELHQFAQKIGLKRSWFQNHPVLPHYDVTQNKYRQALKEGAVPVARREEYEVLKSRRLALCEKEKALFEQ